TAESFNPQGEWRNIEQHHVFDFAGKDTCLNGCSNGHDLIGIDRLVGFFAGNETTYQGLYRWRSGGSAYKHYFIYIARAKFGVLERLLDRAHAAFHQVSRELIELGPGQFR